MQCIFIMLYVSMYIFTVYFILSSLWKNSLGKKKLPYICWH